VGTKSERSTFVAAFSIAFCALALWALANPIFGAPDESWHMLRSSSVVRLESGSTVMSKIPAPKAWPCFSWSPIRTWTADCQNLIIPVEDRPNVNRAGNYPPLAHVIYGLPTFFFDGVTELYAMRFVGVLLCAVAIALAVTILTRRWSRFVSAAVVMLAVVPQVLFYGSSVNPSALSISLSLALGAAVLVAAHSNGRDSRLVRWTIAVAVVAVPMFRRDSAIWMGVLLAVLAIAIGPPAVLRLLRERFYRYVLGAFVLSAVGAQLIVRATTSLQSSQDVAVYYREGVIMGPDEVWIYLRGTFAEFGWGDTPIPPVFMTLGFIVVGGVLLTGLVVARSWWRWGIVAGIALPAILAGVHTYQRYPYFSGRYPLPVLVVVPLLAGLAIERFATDRRLVRNLLGWLAALMVGVQFISFAHNLRRYSVTPFGPLFPDSSAKWNPPGLSVVGYDVLFAALAMVVLLALWWLWMVDRASVDAEPGEPSRAEPDPVENTVP